METVKTAPSASEAQWHRELEDFNARVVGHHLTPTWAFYPELVAKSPPVSYRAYLWKADLLWNVLNRAGELIDLARGGERRSFEVVNPDLRHLHGTTHTIGAALQLVQPGEIAPPHRHLAAAIRFIVKGKGSYTAVQGERLYMEERDLILTPSWTWHEHGNETDQPVVWIDALDYPLNKLLQLSFFQPGGDVDVPPRPVGFTAHRVGFARPAWMDYPDPIPMVTYKWSQVRAAIAAMRDEKGSPEDGILFEYLNPFTQRSVLPTIACYAQLLRSGEHTAAHRHTSSAVYYVLEGEGDSIIGGRRFSWAPGDFFMVPPWAWHEHANGARGDAMFFVVSDKPVVETLGMYREERLLENGGRQRVDDRFTPLRWE
jgi:gentisate 1,2-dioxygenase